MVMLRDELMAEVGGGMEEDRDGGSGGNPSTGRRRHGPKSLPKCDSSSFGYILARKFCLHVTGDLAAKNDLYTHSAQINYKAYIATILMSYAGTMPGGQTLDVDPHTPSRTVR